MSSPEAHALYDAGSLSKLHSKLATPVPPVSALVKVKVASSLSLLLSAGLPVIVGASGAVVSTVHEALVTEPVLPRESLALTSRVCVPSAKSLPTS